MFENADGFPGILGYRVSSLPMMYLGLLLGASYKAKSIWGSAIEKIQQQLASWKMM